MNIKGKFQFKEEIPQETLVAIWHETCPFPFPKIRAFSLSRRHFSSTVSHLNKHLIDVSGEYEKPLPIAKTQAVTFFDYKNQTFIIIRRYRSITGSTLSDDLEHELGHICRGEMTK